MNAQDDFFIPDNTSSSDDDFFIPDRKKGKLEKAGRLAGQVGLGAIEAVTFPYDIAAGAAQGVELPEKFKEFYKYKGKDISPEKIQESDEFRKTYQAPDMTVRGLIGKATGQDLAPEGIFEKAAHWLGFLKNPAKLISSLKQAGTNPKELLKLVAPGAKTLRSVGAATGLQIAEEGDFGPIGTLTAAIVGDLAGGGTAKGAHIATHPRETLAKLAASRANKQLQKQIIQDFRQMGVQPDIGTITGDNVVKMVQSRLAASGLTGEPLDALRKQITEDVANQYKQVADQVGNLRFSTPYEAATAGKEGIQKIANSEKSRIGKFYESFRAGIKESSKVVADKVAQAVEKIETSLSPGAVKSTEQKAVLDTIEKLKSDLITSEGTLKEVGLDTLLNNKIALNEIIDYEVQGGQKQLLKNLVKEIDRAIVSHGKQDPALIKDYIKANKDFSKFAKTFRNKNISQVLRSEDPTILMNKMNTVQGMKDLKNALSTTPEGTELFKDLSRFKLEQMIGDKMKDGVTNQIKHGTFANLLKNPKDYQLVKEIVGPQAFKRLVRLQKLSGKLAETSQKFLNASQSGTVAVDAAIIVKGMKDLGAALMGNPWPLMKTGGMLTGAKYISKLMGDAEFLREVEDMILASGQNNKSKMLQIAQRMEPTIKAAIESSRSE